MAFDLFLLLHILSYASPQTLFAAIGTRWRAHAPADQGRYYRHDGSPGRLGLAQGWEGYGAASRAEPTRRVPSHPSSELLARPGQANDHSARRPRSHITGWQPHFRLSTGIGDQLAGASPTAPLSRPARSDRPGSGTAWLSGETRGCRSAGPTLRQQALRGNNQWGIRSTPTIEM